MDYAAANAAYKRFKTALTRAVNKGDHDAVITVVDTTETYFAARNWPLPDYWSRFERAKEDAEWAKRRAASTW